jgi:hypothetical protein
MPQARYRLVDIQTTPYYHCISRCVRRAFLCGRDRFTGRSFEHRKQWILDRIKHLSSVFSIDVCAYAILSNHFHLVLHVDEAQAATWSEDEVIDRWLALYKGPLVANNYKAGGSLTKLEQDALTTYVEKWRTRLADLSWYMRCLNETIARLANAEDKCTGRFWEGRFKSQALLDEAALVACMAYVDLNPIRAGLNESLETSEFTSIQERIGGFKNNKKENETTEWLKPLLQEKQLSSPSSLPIQETHYFSLVDWTGRAIRDDKLGAIPDHIQPILQRLGVNENNWVANTQHFGSRFHRALGRINRIRTLAFRTEQQWIKYSSSATQFYR